MISNSTRALCVCTLALASLPALGQIAQMSPELCGKEYLLPIPANVSAVSSDAGVDLAIKLPNGTTKIRVSEPQKVQQICPMAWHKLLVFAMLDDFVYDIAVISEETAEVAHVGAIGPRISPDGRWLVYRMPFPLHLLGTTFTEAYGLYDLNKGSADNLVRSTDARIGAGWRVVYPVVPNHAPFWTVGVPDSQTHEFRAASFFWALDSKSVVFADSLPGRLSIVWVRIGAGDEPTAYIHPVSVSEACGAIPAKQLNQGYFTLSHADVGETPDGAAEVRADFSVVESACAPKTLVLHSGEFRKAELERYEPPRSERPAVAK
jgi:hypothetical protein